jgi:hypothetical protein
MAKTNRPRQPRSNTRFTKDQVAEMRKLIDKKYYSNSADQKPFRKELREKYGFRIEEFETEGSAFSVRDFDI